MMFLQLTAAALLATPDRSTGRRIFQRSKMAFAVPIHIPAEHATFQNPCNCITQLTQSSIRNWLEDVVLVPPAFAAEPPSNADVQLLNRAMLAFSNNDATTATDLLTQTIAVWKDQPADELATLYLLRAQSYMIQSQPEQAKDDFSKAIPNLENDLSTAYLGRARAFRSLSLSSSSLPPSSPSSPSSSTVQQLAAAASKDYQLSFQLSTRDDDFGETDQERQDDGASRNPYAAWEWGSSLRTAVAMNSNTGQYREAARVHALASQAFDNIGDHGHAVISLLDAGIDMAAAAASNSDDAVFQEAKDLLTKAIALTTSVQGRDVALLQRVIAKEGEARVALASILWSSSSPGSKQDAEAQLGQACLRLEQLDQDAMERNAKSASGSGAVVGTTSVTSLKYSIDDQAGALDISCARFKNNKFLEDTLQWPASLQGKVRKLNALE